VRKKESEQANKQPVYAFSPFSVLSSLFTLYLANENKNKNTRKTKRKDETRAGGASVIVTISFILFGSRPRHLLLVLSAKGGEKRERQRATMPCLLFCSTHSFIITNARASLLIIFHFSVCF
jgi:hypothetical protein